MPSAARKQAEARALAGGRNHRTTYYDRMTKMVLDRISLDPSDDPEATTLLIKFEVNHSYKGKRKERYERYMHAETVGEALELGASVADLVEDVYEMEEAEVTTTEEIASFLPQGHTSDGYPNGDSNGYPNGYTNGASSALSLTAMSDSSIAARAASAPDEVKRRISDAIADFENVNDRHWDFKKGVVHLTTKTKYAYSNLSQERPRPFKFRLQGQHAQEVLEAAHRDMKQDWDKGAYG